MAERHRLASSLPVTVVSRNGYKEFIVGGKVRARVAVAALASSSIPNYQNEPFHQPDGGASPAAPVSSTKDDCYYEGEPDTCATVQDGEDAVILALSLEADMQQAEADYEDGVNAEEEWCNQNGCLEETEAAPVSGPNVSETPDVAKGCGFEIAVAAIDITLGALARWALYALGAEIAGGVIVATSTIGIVALSAVLGVGAAVLSAYAVYHCVTERNITQPFDEQFGLRFAY